MILEGTKLPAFHSLLAATVDYAGLYPPASLSMDAAVARYRRAREGQESWLVGSFVVSRSALDQLSTVVESARPVAGEGDPWSLSVVLDEAEGDLAAEFESLRKRFGGRLQVAAVEVPPCSVAEIQALASRIPDDVVAFFEIPVDDSLEQRLEAVAAVGAEAKIRLGGVVARAFPPVGDVADFILSCKNRGVPFKATAGLHHPLRGPQRITAEDDSPVCWMHGFLNVILASVFASVGAVADEELVEVLSESESSAFRFSHRRIVWRDREVTVEQIERARRSFFSSFGSCSIDDPLSDLEQIGLLRRQAVLEQV